MILHSCIVFFDVTNKQNTNVRQRVKIIFFSTFHFLENSSILLNFLNFFYNFRSFRRFKDYFDKTWFFSILQFSIVLPKSTQLFCVFKSFWIFIVFFNFFQCIIIIQLFQIFINFFEKLRTFIEWSQFFITSSMILNQVLNKNQNKIQKYFNKSKIVVIENKSSKFLIMIRRFRTQTIEHFKIQHIATIYKLINVFNFESIQNLILN